ncbi:MAG: hypothetical protein JNK76_04115 [Planctomycetales bacterium]|nr:hypothetical protein [Planctomycetales bacterium]MBN8627274.1 hypothetical protein [Planctomycetota bacterium]
MKPVIAPQARLIAGMARVDITPPIGMYHRMWGAAIHDRSTGVHRPLTATALWMQPREAAGERCDAVLLLAIDHCILERTAMDALREAAGHATGIPAAQVHVCLSHTHGAGFMSRSRAELPGGEMIGPYLDEMTRLVGRCAEKALATVRSAVLVCGTGRSALAAHRDGYDSISKQYVCGFHPEGPADDTLVVGRLTTDSNDVTKPGRTIGTLVNYACHPTTLAWQNTLVSPDYVGALREVVETATAGAPCFFMQGASGDLGPRDGFVGDVATADRNGRQVGYDVLAAFEALPPPGTQFVYQGPVVSGATLGTWKHERLSASADAAHGTWQHDNVAVSLDYRPDLPTIGEAEQELARWTTEENAARSAGDEPRLREARAQAERMTRQLSRLRLLPKDKQFPYAVSVARTGTVLWVIATGELYQVLQVELRRRFPQFAVFVTTIADDWQPGYLPEAAIYGRGIYQEQIAVVAAGSLETVIQRVGTALQKLSALA